MVLEDLLPKLIDQRDSYGRAALLQTSSGDGFTLGKICGTYQGLSLAVQEVERLLREEADREAERENA